MISHVFSGLPAKKGISMRRGAQDAHTFGVQSRVLTYAEPCRYDYESDLHGRSARMETEGGPPTAKKCRVVELNGIARKASEKTPGTWRCWKNTHRNISRGKMLSMSQHAKDGAREGS
jgi:hypothetical protein